MKEKKPPFATTELVYGQFYTLSWPTSEMGIRFIDKILNICICNNISDTPPSFFIYLNKLKQKNQWTFRWIFRWNWNWSSCTSTSNTFINFMKLDEKQTKELEEIINFVQTAAHKLLVNMILICLYALLYMNCCIE